MTGDDEIQELVRQLGVRIENGTVLGEEPAELGRRLWAAAGAGSRDLPVEAAAAFASLHWLRYLKMPVSDDSPDLATALLFFARIAEIDASVLPRPVTDLLAEGLNGRDDPERWLTTATEMLRQAEKQEDVAYADKALHMFRMARAWFPADSPIRPHIQGHVAAALYLRFLRTRRFPDLDAAVVTAEDALAADPKNWFAHSTLGLALSCRFEERGEPRDLSRALDHARLAGAKGDDGSEEFGTYLSNLCGCLLDNYRLTGQDALLHEAVDVGRRAVLIAESPVALTNFSSALRARHQAFGRRADIDDVIALARKALENIDERRVDTVRANLVDVLVRGGADDDLDEAIALGERLLNSIPAGHPLRPQVATNVALALRGLSDDNRDRALALEREALSALARTNPRWQQVAANTAHSLIERAAEQQSTRDLTDGLALIEEALSATAEGDPSLAWRLQVIATGLELRAKRHHRQADRTKALMAWQRSSSVSASPTDLRLQSAVRGGQWAEVALGDQAAALQCYSSAVALLDRLAWRGLARPEQEARLSTWTGLVRDAAAIAVGENDPGTAVRLAEQGRAVLWGQLTSGRSGLAALREAAPALAERLSEIANAVG